MIFQSRGPLRSFDKLKIPAFPGRPMGIKLGKVVTHRDSPEILFPVRLHNPLTTWSNKKIHNILKKLHLLYHQTFLWLLNLAGWWLQTEGSYHKCLSQEWLLTPSHQYSWMDGKFSNFSFILSVSTCHQYWTWHTMYFHPICFKDK